MTKSNQLFIILLLLLASCYDKKTEEAKRINLKQTKDSATLGLNGFKYFNNSQLVEEDLKKAILYGDTDAYNQISTYYFMQHKEVDFLYYSLIMSNKFNYSYAYFDVYSILTILSSVNNFDSLDNKSKNLAFFYLAKSYELDNPAAKEEVESIIGKDKIMRPNFYLSKVY